MSEVAQGWGGPRKTVILFWTANCESTCVRCGGEDNHRVPEASGTVYDAGAIVLMEPWCVEIFNKSQNLYQVLEIHGIPV